MEKIPQVLSICIQWSRGANNPICKNTLRTFLFSPIYCVFLILLNKYKCPQIMHEWLNFVNVYMWSKVVIFYSFPFISCRIFLFHSVCKVIFQTTTKKTLFWEKEIAEGKKEPLFCSFNFIVYVMELHTLYNTKRAIARNVSFLYFFAYDKLIFFCTECLKGVAWQKEEFE